jgi:hypothetical protein
MINKRKIVGAIDAALSRAGSKVIAERIFYDDVSDRVYVTLFNGPRKTEVILPGRWFDGQGAGSIDQTISDGIKRLGYTPIG